MTEQLSLTPEQAEKVKAIYAKNAEAMKPLREKGRDNLTEEDRTKMREMFKTQQDEIAAVLTPEQKKKQEELRAQRGGPGGEGRRRGGDRPPGDKPEAK
jgi:Spy/CpxP family protein refolding chaperone